MKSLLIYDSKKGTTQEISEHIANTITNTSLCPIAEIGDVSLNSYDRIIIGSPIYYAKPSKRIISFINNHEELLLTKELHLFLVGAITVSFPSEFYPTAILDHATSQHCFGGQLLKNKLSFVERLVTKTVMNSKGMNPDNKDLTNTINHEQIQACIDILNGVVR